MSLWTSLTGIFRKALPAVAGIALPGVGGVVAGGLISGAQSHASGARGTAPHWSPRRSNLPVPGVSGAIERFLPGGKTGYTSRGAFHVGKLSGGNVPRGFYEKMDPKTGQIYWSKRRRRRGISGRDIATYRRVDRFLQHAAKSPARRRK